MALITGVRQGGPGEGALTKHTQVTRQVRQVRQVKRLPTGGVLRNTETGNDKVGENERNREREREE